VRKGDFLVGIVDLGEEHCPSEAQDKMRRLQRQEGWLKQPALAYGNSSVPSSLLERSAGCHGPSTLQPDAPESSAEEKVGLLRSG